MPPFLLIYFIESINPCPKGFPTLEVGPVKSTKWPIGISLAEQLYFKKKIIKR